RHEVEYALATTSCTTGLHLALMALGIGPGDEVIIPAFSWVATANVVLYCGAKPVFCDVDTETFNIKLEDIPNKLTEKTKAIIPVHLFGLCADIDAIRNMLPSQVKIIEDAACAAGATYKGRSAGSLGDMAAFSFHPRKSITTGEGGMLTSNNKSQINLAEIMRNHGSEIPEEIRHASAKPYIMPDFKMLGFNYRMTDLQAAVGLVQLSKLDRFLHERLKWANYYKEHLQAITWLKPQKLPSYCTRHAWQSFVCYIEPEKSIVSRNELMDFLLEKGISTRPGTHAIHSLKFYQDKFEISIDEFPGARDCERYTLAIPLHNNMTKSDFDYVIETFYTIQ
ncbi:MAG: DegT/DnrJ/EryC1/StrS family aminotransferase, partial [Rickettsia endosymbiont of Ixodes persulcatus]|nr:DegT/DnrJ/EryC1/StrS family aminotransferase [Rickettsia endosymbiont of Ixodes persulcatus]